MTNEFRKDYLLDRWVIIASERVKRPSDFKVKPKERNLKKACPFCPGNEDMTPPANLIYVLTKGGLVKGKDDEGPRRRDWIIRCFPNLYPALRPDALEIETSISKLLMRSRGRGYHEVCVESPKHDDQPSSMDPKQLKYAFEAQIERSKFFYSDPTINYVQIFRNYGREAGASLSHPHTQIIATEQIPKKVMEEVKTAKLYEETEGDCVFCDIILLEREGNRLIYEDEEFMVICPWASIAPFEFWILPKNHRSCFTEVPEGELENFSKVLRGVMGSLSKILNDPSYNYVIHTAPKGVAGEDDFYHWHLRTYPKLATWAGFEIGTGVYINVTPPEVAAEGLRSFMRKM